MQGITNNLPILIIHLDAQYRVLFISPAAGAWFGPARERPAAHDLREILGAEAFALIESPLERAFTGEAVELQGRVIDLEGRERHVQVSCVPEKFVAGAGGTAFVLLCDRTRERERLQAIETAGHRHRELAHAGRIAALGDLASDIAHQVNQPLTAILSTAQACLQLVNAGEAPVEDLLKALQRIVHQAQRGGDIVARIRNHARRPGEGEREPHSLADLVESVLDLMAADLRRHGVKVISEFPGALPALAVSRIEIELVLIHLIHNAIEAMVSVKAGQREIRIAGETEGNRVRLRVADRGPGIPPDRIGELFNTFYTTEPAGLGQGLSISRAIIEAHDGTLQAACLPEGGAEFTIVLPFDRERSGSGDSSG